jgi:hypothetical protein
MKASYVGVWVLCLLSAAAQAQQKPPAGRSGLDPASPLGEDVHLLIAQAERCREILRKLSRTPDTGDEHHSRMSLTQLLDEVSEPHRGEIAVNTEVTCSAGAPILEVRRLPEGLMTSLTWDRGKEMADHKSFKVATDVAVYFCDPQSPWQRGTNENTNGLLRQYFPKGTDLSVFSQQDLDQVANQLNTRPRMTLGYKTPAYVLAHAVAPTG